MTSERSPAALDMARLLLAREVAGLDAPAEVGAAMQRVCTRISENLRGSVGDDGYEALLNRVLAPAAAEHPALLEMRRDTGRGIHLDDVAASIEGHGVPAVSAALEAMLASMIDVLGGLIGPDMVMNVLDRDTHHNSSSNGRPKI